LTPPEANAPLRVVIVDNDPDALDLLDLDLALEGHEIVGKGRSGDEAIDLCRRLRPDVLVVDFRMPPGPNGLDVAEALKEQPGLTTVLYTNYRDPKNASRAASYGASYLHKGDLRTLRKALREVSGG
jgi:DNA-binding NarL/FixJ family response regulator